MAMPAARLRRNQLPERARCLVEHGHSRFTYHPIEILRRMGDFFGNHLQTATIEQRAPYLPYGKIKSMRVEQGPNVSGVKLEPMLRGREQPDYVSMLDHYALGHS